MKLRVDYEELFLSWITRNSEGIGQKIMMSTKMRDARESDPAMLSSDHLELHNDIVHHYSIQNSLLNMQDSLALSGSYQF